MLLTPIQDECYASHKAGEMPRRFRLGDEWVEVEDVLDRWYQIESLAEWPRADYQGVRSRPARVSAQARPRGR